MNAFIIILDPFLHTVEYVRRHSVVLFTTMLAVSAKFTPRPVSTAIGSCRSPTTSSRRT